jgi:hypothetical protein
MNGLLFDKPKEVRDKIKITNASSNTFTSNVAKSTRRIFFYHLEESFDCFYGTGTGILLRYKNKFFLLTAEHVLQENLKEAYKIKKYQNDSPFRILTKSDASFSGRSWGDFMFPKKIWNISELISEQKKFHSITLKDICLIELFEPLSDDFYPDNFIEIKGNSILSKKDFFEGQWLVVSGFPFEKNMFDWSEPKSKEFTHSTTIQRNLTCGVFIKELEFGYISFEYTDAEISSNSLNGMSGGAVFNVQPKNNMVRLAGMAISAGDNKCRFIPAFAFLNAIFNYKKSSSNVIDPAYFMSSDIRNMNNKDFLLHMKEFEVFQAQLQTNR